GRTTDRQLRLFLAGCCRQIWGMAPDDPTLVGLAVAEHLAEIGGLPLTKTEVRIPAGQAAIDCDATDPVESLEVWHGDRVAARVNLLKLKQPLVFILNILACGRPDRWTPLGLVSSLDHIGLEPRRQAQVFRDIVRFPSRWKTVPARQLGNAASTIQGLAQS